MNDSSATAVVAWLEKHQIPLYLLALLVGAVTGLSAPSSAHTFETAINPVLIVLLYATFLAVPFSAIGASLRDGRFLVTVVVLNFVLVPIVVFALTRFVTGNQAVLVGVLLVLLAPCIDYVIVFSGLAGAASERLLVSAPLLMLLQILFFPLYLWLFVGSELVEIIDIAPFVEAFVLLIVAPLTLAALTQALARRHRIGTQAMDLMASVMVPVMMATLAVVVASQIDAVRTEGAKLVGVVPIFAAFLIIMAVVGLATARVTRQDSSHAGVDLFRCHPQFVGRPASRTRAPTGPVSRSGRRGDTDIGGTDRDGRLRPARSPPRPEQCTLRQRSQRPPHDHRPMIRSRRFGVVSIATNAIAVSVHYAVQRIETL